MEIIINNPLDGNMPELLDVSTTTPPSIILEHGNKTACDIFNHWNLTASALGLAQMRKITTDRVNKLNLRLRDCPPDQFKQAISQIAHLDRFYFGDNKTNWHIDIEYMLRPNNAIKILEKTNCAKMVKKSPASLDNICDNLSTQYEKWQSIKNDSLEFSRGYNKHINEFPNLLTYYQTITPATTDDALYLISRLEILFNKKYETTTRHEIAQYLIKIPQSRLFSVGESIKNTHQGDKYAHLPKPIEIFAIVDDIRTVMQSQLKRIATNCARGINIGHARIPEQTNQLAQIMTTQHNFGLN